MWVNKFNLTLRIYCGRTCQGEITDLCMLYQKAHSDDKDRLDMANFILVSCQIQFLTKVTLNLSWPLTTTNLNWIWCVFGTFWFFIVRRLLVVWFWGTSNWNVFLALLCGFWYVINAWLVVSCDFWPRPQRYNVKWKTALLNSVKLFASRHLSSDFL